MPVNLEEHKKAEVHNALGVIYRKKGKYDRAISEYEKALQFDPEYPVVYNNLGFIYYRKGLFDKAIECYKKSIEFDPGYVLAYNKLGVVYRRKGLYKKAIEVYKQAIEIRSDYTEAYYNMAIVYRHMKKYDEALEMYKKVIELKPDHIPAHVNLGLAYKYKGEYEKAIEEYEIVLKADPSYIEIYINLGIVYFFKGEYSKALEDLNYAIEKDPQNPISYYYLGMIYDSGRDYSKAMEQYKKVLEIEPHFQDVDKKISNIYIKNGDKLTVEKKYNEAITQYKSALEISKNSEIYFKIAYAYEEGSMLEEAIAVYERLDLGNEKNENNQFKEKIKDLLLRAGDNAVLSNQFVKATAYFKRILENYPDELDIHYRLGETLLMQNMTGEAINEFNFIKEKDPDFPGIKEKLEELSFTIIFSLIKERKLDEAIIRCKEILTRNPEDMEALYGLGIIYNEKDLIDESIDIFEKIAKKDVNFKNVKLKLVQLYTNKAEAFFAKIRYQDAFEQYKKIIQIDPDNIECVYKVALLYDKRKRYDEALEYYEKIFQKSKDYKDVLEKIRTIYLWKANVLFTQKKLDESILLFKKILEVDPNKTAPIYFKIATIYEKRNMLFEAVENYEKARANDAHLTGLQEKILDLYYLIADEFIKQNCFMEAITYYEKIIAINPNKPEIYYTIAKCYNKRHVPAKAFEYFEKAKQQGANFPDMEKSIKDVLIELGENYLKEHIFDKAEEQFHKLTELYPKEPEFIFKLGNVYENMLEFDKAIEQYKKLKDINPDYKGLLSHLERVYLSKANDLFDKEKLTEASQEYKNTLAVSPKNIEATYQIAIIYEKSGSKTESYNMYKTVYEIDKDYRDISEIMERMTAQHVFNLFEEKKYDEAFAECSQLILTDPNSAKLHFIMGEIYLIRNEKNKALLEYEEVLKLDNNYSEVKNRLEEIYLYFALDFIKNNKTDTARNLFEKIINLNPKSIQANYNLGIIYENNGNFDKAAEAYDRVIEIDKNYQDIPKKIGQLYAKAGAIFFDKSDNDNAGKYYEKAIANGIENEEIFYRLGTIYENRGSLDKAKKFFDKILKKSEGDHYKDISEKLEELDLHRMEIYLEEEKYAEAIREAKKILEKNPDNIEIQYNLAVAFEKRKFHKEAIQYFENLLKHQPDYLDVKERLKNIYMDKANKLYQMGNYSDALKDYTEIMKFDVNKYEIDFNIANCYLNLQDFDKAMEIARRGLLHNSDDKLYHNLLGVIYTQKCMYDEAILEFQKCINIDKNFAEAYNNLGLAYIKKGMYADAMKEFKTAVKIDPNIEIKFKG